MKYSEEQKLTIFEKRNGKCVYCHKQLAYGNYGIYGMRGAWQIDHSKSKARGGSDHLNNYYAACIECNQGKSDMPARTFKELTEPERDFRRMRARNNDLKNALPIISFFSLLGISLFSAPRLEGNEKRQQQTRYQTQQAANQTIGLPWGTMLCFGIVIVIFIAIIVSHREV